MKVNGKDDIPYIMENKKCLKPPTSKISWNNTILRSTSSEQVLRLPADTIWADNLAPALLSELKNNTQLSESLLYKVCMYIYMYKVCSALTYWVILACTFPFTRIDPGKTMQNALQLTCKPIASADEASPTTEWKAWPTWWRTSFNKDLEAINDNRWCI